MEWFKFYTRWLSAFQAMSDEEAGQVIKTILQFVRDRQYPQAAGGVSVFVHYVLAEIEQDIQIYEDAIVKDQARKAEKSRKCRMAAQKRWSQ